MARKTSVAAGWRTGWSWCWWSRETHSGHQEWVAGEGSDTGGDSGMRRALPDLSSLIHPAPNTVPGTLLLKYRFLKVKRRLNKC